MSDLDSKLAKYKNLDISKYVNETLPKYEKSVMVMEHDRITKLKKEVETEIFKAFIINSDSLLEILDTYELVYNKMTFVKDHGRSLNQLFVSIKNDEKPNVDKTKLEKFKSVIKKFTSDVSSFDTGQRTLEHFDILHSRDDEYIIIMTNDILIIGKVLTETRQYTLVNAINYSVIDMKIKDDELKIFLSQTEMVYYGEKEKIQGIYDKYREMNYNDDGAQSASSEDATTNKNNDKDLVEYILMTEKYELLNDMNIEEISKSDKLYGAFHDKTKFIKFIQLCKVKHLDKDANILIVNFLNKTFKDTLYKTSRSKHLKQLIEDIFNLFYKFYNEERCLIKQLNKIIDIDHIKMAIMVECHIKECIGYIETRLFNKRFYSKAIEEVCKILKEKVQFHGQDYTYLVVDLEKKADEFMKGLLEKTKAEIDEMVTEYLKEN